MRRRISKEHGVKTVTNLAIAEELPVAAQRRSKRGQPVQSDTCVSCRCHPGRAGDSLGVLALPHVGQRNDHQDALGAGLGVTEFAQERRASEEVRELWRWVSKKLVEGGR